MVFKNVCNLVLWTKVASALEGLKYSLKVLLIIYPTLVMLKFNLPCFRWKEELIKSDVVFTSSSSSCCS